MLEISPQKVCYALTKAKEFSVKEGVVLPADGSNLADEDYAQILADHGEDTVAQELLTFLAGLTEEELAAMLALSWVGRGEASVEEWDQVMADARERLRPTTPQRLLADPQLADFLREGLAAHGHDCADVEMLHL